MLWWLCDCCDDWAESLGGVWGPRDFVTLGPLMVTKTNPAFDVAINYDWSLDMSFNHNLAYCHYLAATALAKEQENGKTGPGKY